LNAGSGGVSEGRNLGRHVACITVNLCAPARDDLYMSRYHPRANHRPMTWMDQLHARFSVVPRRNGEEIEHCAPSVWLCVIALAGRYPSAACVHLAPLREGIAWVACLAGLARVRARVRAYEGTPHRLHAQLRPRVRAPAARKSNLGVPLVTHTKSCDLLVHTRLSAIII